MQALLREAHISYQLKAFHHAASIATWPMAPVTSGLASTAPDYEGKVLYGDQPIITLHLQLYWLPEVAPLQTLEQLREQN